MSIFFSCFYKKSDRRHKKVFEHYNDLFPEIRTMVINEMETEDRCRFTRCSKLSSKEAKASKNYIYALVFQAYDWSTMIHVAHKDWNFYHYKDLGYDLEFREYSGRKCMKYGGNVPMWEEELDGSTDLMIHAAEHFKQVLRLYQHQIKHLRFTGPSIETKLGNYDFGIENLNRLQVLEVHGDMDVIQYISALRRPLEYLVVHSGRNSSLLSNCDEIYQVKDRLIIKGTILTFQQMLQLSASRVIIPFGNITVMEIFNFIRSWQNGTMRKEVICYEWDNENGAFDIPELFRLLGLTQNLSRNDRLKFEIEHYEDAGRKATLYSKTTYPWLMFRVKE